MSLLKHKLSAFRDRALRGRSCRITVLAICLLAASLQLARQQTCLLTFDLGAKARGLDEALFVLHQQQEVQYRVRYAFHEQPAPRSLERKLPLPPGEYMLDAELRYRLIDDLKIIRLSKQVSLRDGGMTIVYLE